ncbi:MAG: MobA/MobL family protein [Desulfovibrio sp.]|nr:MobA/MobL family protein [Desulfovibrio sp.]
MAIYHFCEQVLSRSKGQSAVAAAAYRSGSVLTDGFGSKHDYSKRHGVVRTRIYVPDGCPTVEREELWCLAERTDKRKNSCLAREANIALPVELSSVERSQVSEKFCTWLANEYGVAVDCCEHAGEKRSAQENRHIHVQWTTRRYMPDGTLGVKTRELDDLKTRKEHLIRIRSKWADICNAYLQYYGTSIDARSYEDQGIEQLPQIHVGLAATAMERCGIATERGAINKAIIALNREMQKLKKEEKEVTEELEIADAGGECDQAVAVSETEECLTEENAAAISKLEVREEDGAQAPTELEDAADIIREDISGIRKKVIDSLRLANRRLIMERNSQETLPATAGPAVEQCTEVTNGDAGKASHVTVSKGESNVTDKRENANVDGCREQPLSVPGTKNDRADEKADAGAGGRKLEACPGSPGSCPFGINEAQNATGTNRQDPSPTIQCAAGASKPGVGTGRGTENAEGGHREDGKQSAAIVIDVETIAELVKLPIFSRPAEKQCETAAEGDDATVSSSNVNTEGNDVTNEREKADMGGLRQQRVSVPGTPDYRADETTDTVDRGGQGLGAGPESSGYGSPAAARPQDTAGTGKQGGSTAVQCREGASESPVGPGRELRHAENGSGDDEQPAAGLNHAAALIAQDISALRNAVMKKVRMANRRLTMDHRRQASLSALERRFRNIIARTEEIRRSTLHSVSERDAARIDKAPRPGLNLRAMTDKVRAIVRDCSVVRQHTMIEIMGVENRYIVRRTRQDARLRDLKKKSQAIENELTSIIETEYASVDGIDTWFMEDWLEDMPSQASTVEETVPSVNFTP